MFNCPFEKKRQVLQDCSLLKICHAGSHQSSSHKGTTKSLTLATMADSILGTSTSQADAELEETLTSMANMYEPHKERLCDFYDVCLIVEDEKHPAIHIEVSSVVLSMASPVFKAMFSGKFAEAKQSEISLKDDNPTAMLVLCRLLHHLSVDLEDLKPWDNWNVTERYTLLDFAVLADKYDCAETLKHYAISKFYEFREKKDRQSWTKVAAAAYIFDQPAHFKFFTSKMVLSKEVYDRTQLQDEDAWKVLPSHILLLLREQLDTALLEASCLLSNLIDDAARVSDRLAATDNNYFTTILKALRQFDLWPLEDALRDGPDYVILRLQSLKLPTFTRIVTEVERANDWNETPRMRSLQISDRLFGDDKISNAPTQHHIEAIVQKINDLCIGVCLDCIKNPEDSQGCRIPHTLARSSCGRRVERKWGAKSFEQEFGGW